MGAAPETFKHYLERTLADSGLRSYGYNTAANEAAEEMCYQRALDCFSLTIAAAWGIHSTPLADECPPWGIHSPEGDDAPPEAALGDDGGPGDICGPGGRNPCDEQLLPPGRAFPPWTRFPYVPATAEPVQNDGTVTYSFGAAARGLIEHHLDRVRLHLTQIGHILDANHDK